MAGFEDDDIGKDVEAALAGTALEAPPSTGAAAAPETPPDTTVEKPSGVDRPRDETGKFIARTEATEKAPAAEKTTQPSPSPAAPQPPSQQQAAPTPITAPLNWKGSAKVDWNRLPRDVQQALADDHTRITQAETELGKFRSVITPERAQALIAETGSVEQGLSRLLAISDIATQNPAGFIQWFAQQRGIDLRQFGQGAPQGSEQQPAAAPNPLVNEVVQLRNQVQQLIQQQTQGAQTQVLSEIDAFARDPAHPYFNDVREHMGALMKAGKAGTLQEAYDMATWAHPDVRKSLLEQQSQQAMQASAQKVQQAKQAASGSITGSPAGAKVPSEEPERDLEAELKRNVSAVFG